MKQVTKKVSYDLYCKKYTPSEKDKKARAWRWLFAVNALQEVGAGADECVHDIRTMIGTMRQICLRETGYNIIDSSYTLTGGHYKGWKKCPYPKDP